MMFALSCIHHKKMGFPTICGKYVKAGCDMSPEEFIKKHITDALLGEGFPAEIARGGQSMALITTVAALSPPERGACLLIVFSGLVSGLSVKRQRQNATPGRKSRDVTARAACFNRRRYVPGLCAG